MLYVLTERVKNSTFWKAWTWWSGGVQVVRRGVKRKKDGGRGWIREWEEELDTNESYLRGEIFVKLNSFLTSWAYCKAIYYSGSSRVTLVSSRVRRDSEQGEVAQEQEKVDNRRKSITDQYVEFGVFYSPLWGNESQWYQRPTIRQNLVSSGVSTAFESLVSSPSWLLLP